MIQPVSIVPSAALPAFGIARVTGATAVEAGVVYRSVAQTDLATTWTPTYLVNGPCPVDANGYGAADQCIYGAEMFVSYRAAAGTPAAGEIWGPKSGQWTLEKYYPGFRVVGAVLSTEDVPRALFVPVGIRSLLGVTDGAIAAVSGTTPTSGTVSVYYYSGSGAMTDTTYNVTAYNMAGAVATSKNVQLKLIGERWWVDVEDCQE